MHFYHIYCVHFYYIYRMHLIHLLCAFLLYITCKHQIPKCYPDFLFNGTALHHSHVCALIPFLCHRYSWKEGIPELARCLRHPILTTISYKLFLFSSSINLLIETFNRDAKILATEGSRILKGVKGILFHIF